MSYSEYESEYEAALQHEELVKALDKVQNDWEIKYVNIKQNGRWYRIAPMTPWLRLWNWLRGYRR